MAITRIGSATGVTSATIPAHQAGDLILLFAYRDGSTTQPTAPTGWTDNQVIAGSGNTNAARLHAKIAVSSAETTGTWTNATSVIVVVYRASAGSTIGVGVSNQNGGTSTTINYPALAGMRTDNTSWVAGFAGHRSTNTALETAPDGMTFVNGVVDATDEVAMHDTNGTVTAWPSTSVSVGGTNSGYRSIVVEITETPPLEAFATAGAMNVAGQVGFVSNGAAPPAGITYTGPQTFAPASSATISVTVDTGAAEAGRIVLLAFTGDTTGNYPAVSSSSFGGVSGTPIAVSDLSNEDQVVMIAAVVPNGTGNQTISVTMSETYFNLSVAAWIIRGAEFPASDGDFNIAATYPYAPVIALTIPEGGAAFSVAAANLGETPTVSVGATALTSTTAANSAGTRTVTFSDATDLTAGSVNWTQTGQLTFTAAAAVFTPAAGGGGGVTATATEGAITLQGQVGDAVAAAASGAVVASTTGNPTITTGVSYEGMTGTTYQWGTAGGSITFSAGGPVYPLIIAGGGAGGIGGGYERAAGGGAGGMVGGYPAHPNFSFEATASAYAIAVGLGGVPSTSVRGIGPNGGNSSITGVNAPPAAVGGGGGATQNEGSFGNPGGSGGGNTFSGGETANLGTTGQGNSGSQHPNIGQMGGGGGGAGTAGQAPTAADQALQGGDGLQSSITGTPVWYAGGAGGSMGMYDPGLGIAQGGLGGGGRTSTLTYADRSGVDGTGGGGAPGINTTNDAERAGKGGDGTVILFVPDTVSNTAAIATAGAITLAGQVGVATASGNVPARVTLSGTYGITRTTWAPTANTLTLEIRCSWTTAATSMTLMASETTGWGRETNNNLQVYTEDLGAGTFVSASGYGTSSLVTLRYEIDPAGGLAGGNTLRVLVDGVVVMSSTTAGTTVDTSALYFFQNNGLLNRFTGEVEYLTLWINGSQVLDIRGDATVWNAATGAVGTVTDVPGTGGGGSGTTATATAGAIRLVGQVGVAAGSSLAVVQYYYLNSLVSHETGAWTSSTRLPNWMARLASAAGNTYSVDSEFGFLSQWDAPPDCAMGFEDAASTPMTASSWTNGSQITRVSFTPDNFDGVNYDPDAIGNLHSVSYQDTILALIDAWESNAPNASRVYAIYAGWPDMGPYGDPATITAPNLLAWQNWGLGTYQNWMELLVSRLQAARPGLDIRISDVNRVLMLTYQNTVVSTISAADLFEDDAPHGRSSWYFLAALVEYMEAYGVKPPAGYVPDAGYAVNATITSNYQTIVDYMWDQLVATGSTAIAGSIGIAGQVGVVTATAAQSAIATAGATRLTGQVGVVTAPRLAQATAGSVTLAGQQGVVASPRAAIATAGATRITGQAGVVLAPRTATATAGAVRIAGQIGAATASDAQAFLATAGAMRLQGQAGFVFATNPATATATAGALTADGQIGRVVAPRLVQATAGSIAADGQIGVVQAPRAALATAGASEAQGQVGAVTATAHVWVSAGNGAMRLSGQEGSVAATANRTAIATAGEIVAQGQASVVALSNASAAFAQPGAVGVRGQAPTATITANLWINATAGATRLVGQVGTAATPRVARAEAGSTGLEGQPGTVTAPRLVTAAHGALTADGAQGTALATAHIWARAEAGAIRTVGAEGNVVTSAMVVVRAEAGVLRVAGSAGSAVTTEDRFAFASAGAIRLRGNIGGINAADNQEALAQGGTIQIAGQPASVALTAHVWVRAEAGALAADGAQASATATANVWARAEAGQGELTGQAGHVAAPRRVEAQAGILRISGGEVFVRASDHIRVEGGFGETELAGSAPRVTANVAARPGSGAIILRGAEGRVVNPKSAHPEAGIIITDGSAMRVVVLNPSPTPESRTVAIPEANRLVAIPAASRLVTIAAAPRTVVVPATTRTVRTGE